MKYNGYQQMYHASLYGNKAKSVKKYALFNGTEKVLDGDYGLLVHKKRQMVLDGRLGYLLKIKAI